MFINTNVYSSTRRGLKADLLKTAFLSMNPMGYKLFGVEDEFLKRIQLTMIDKMRHAIPGYHTFVEMFYRRKSAEYGRNLYQMIIDGRAEDLTGLFTHRSTFADMCSSVPTGLLQFHFLYNYLLPILREKFSGTPTPTPGPTPTPTPEPEPGPDTCQNHNCNSRPGYISKINPQCADPTNCTFENCCKLETSFNGIPINVSNDCDNKCFNSEDKCSNVNRVCNIIIPPGQNKTIINNTNSTLDLYEQTNTSVTNPTDVNSCCQLNGLSNPFGKGCKWQQGKDKLFNCGCYQYFEPTTETNIVTLVSNNSYGNVTTYTPNLNFIITESVKKSFNKKLKKDKISEMNDEDLPSCYNKDNSDIQKCANTSQKLTEYGYDGCIWNNYKLYE